MDRRLDPAMEREQPRELLQSQERDLMRAYPRWLPERVRALPRRVDREGSIVVANADEDVVAGSHRRHREPGPPAELRADGSHQDRVALTTSQDCVEKGVLRDYAPRDPKPLSFEEVEDRVCVILDLLAPWEAIRQSRRQAVQRRVRCDGVNGLELLGDGEQQGADPRGWV